MWSKTNQKSPDRRKGLSKLLTEILILQQRLCYRKYWSRRSITHEYKRVSNYKNIIFWRGSGCSAETSPADFLRHRVHLQRGDSNGDPQWERVCRTRSWAFTTLKQLNGWIQTSAGRRGWSQPGNSRLRCKNREVRFYFERFTVSKVFPVWNYWRHVCWHDEHTCLWGEQVVCRHVSERFTSTLLFSFCFERSVREV